MNTAKPHRKQIEHHHELGDFHELTFSCYQRLPLLTNDDWRTRLSSCINEAIVEACFQLAAFVYMPEHVHLLVLPIQLDPDIGRFLARLKQPYSKQIKNVLLEHRSPLLEKLTIRERPGKFCFRYWQEGAGYDRNIYSSDALEASLDYIHKNPVKRGLCKRAIDWKWSSARYYHLSPPKQQFPDLPHLHGIPPDALDESKTR